MPHCKMSILLIVPNLRKKGGVANYYRILLPKIGEKVEVLQLGEPNEKVSPFKRLISCIRDYLEFNRLMFKRRYDVVHVNPSFNIKSLIRDGIFIVTAKFWDAKVITFFHGWHTDFEEKLEKIGLSLFKWVYNKTDVFIVLSTRYRSKLKRWGFKQPVIVETTVVDEKQLELFRIGDKIEEYKKASTKRILFLSRIIKKKGVLIAIEAVRLVASKKDVVLYIAGTGSDVSLVLEAAERHRFVRFVDYVEGDKKTELLVKSHIFIFPTLYEEGMPTVIVEAMAFGMPILSRDVEGVSDLLRMGMQGFVTKSTEPAVFAEFLDKLLSDNNLYARMAKENYEIAVRNFLAKDAAQRLWKIYEQVCQSAECN